MKYNITAKLPEAFTKITLKQDISIRLNIDISIEDMTSIIENT